MDNDFMINIWYLIYDFQNENLFSSIRHAALLADTIKV